MKKILTVCTVALTLMLAGSPAASSIDNALAAAPLQLIVDGENALTALRPFALDGIIYVPVRVLTEFHPGTLSWDNLSKQLSFTDSYSSAILSPGSDLLRYGGGDYTMEGQALLRSGHVYLPAGELNSLTGASYEQDEINNAVRITSGSLSTTVRIPKEPLALAEDASAVKLYAALKDGDTYKGHILEVNGRKHTFDWETARLLSYPPELYYADVDADGTNEAVVILTLGTGTGIVEQEIHVVRPDNWSEAAVTPAGEAAAKLISSSYGFEGADLLVRLKLADSMAPEVTIRLADRADDGLPKESVGFGSVVYYKVESGKLTAETNVVFGFAESIGSLKLVYKSGAAGMEPESVTFIPFDEYPASMK